MCWVASLRNAGGSTSTPSITLTSKAQQPARGAGDSLARAPLIRCSPTTLHLTVRRVARRFPSSPHQPPLRAGKRLSDYSRPSTAQQSAAIEQKQEAKALSVAEQLRAKDKEIEQLRVQLAKAASAPPSSAGSDAAQSQAHQQAQSSLQLGSLPPPAAAAPASRQGASSSRQTFVQSGQFAIKSSRDLAPAQPSVTISLALPLQPPTGSAPGSKPGSSQRRATPSSRSGSAQTDIDSVRALPDRLPNAEL